MSTKSTHSFVVAQGDDSRTVEGRRAAIRQARVLSEKSHRPVRIERDDRKISMLFKRGALEVYKRETR